MAFAIDHKLSASEINTLTERGAALYEARHGEAPVGYAAGLRGLHADLCETPAWIAALEEVTGCPTLDHTGPDGAVVYYAGHQA